MVCVAGGPRESAGFATILGLGRGTPGGRWVFQGEETTAACSSRFKSSNRPSFNEVFRVGLLQGCKGKMFRSRRSRCTWTPLQAVGQVPQEKERQAGWRENVFWFQCWMDQHMMDALCPMVGGISWISYVFLGVLVG